MPHLNFVILFFLIFFVSCTHSEPGARPTATRVAEAAAEVVVLPRVNPQLGGPEYSATLRVFVTNYTGCYLPPSGIAVVISNVDKNDELARALIQSNWSTIVTAKIFRKKYLARLENVSTQKKIGETFFFYEGDDSTKIHLKLNCAR